MEVPWYLSSMNDVIDALLLPNLSSENNEDNFPPKPADAVDCLAASARSDSPSTRAQVSTWFGASVKSAVSLIVSELTLRQIGQNMPDGPIKTELIARVDASIAEFLDGYCGNGGPSARFPWPGPPPWVLPTVNQLSLVAGTIVDPELRDSVLNVAAAMAQKSLACSTRS